jgi:hypothetical protein
MLPKASVRMSEIRDETRTRDFTNSLLYSGVRCHVLVFLAEDVKEE